MMIGFDETSSPDADSACFYSKSILLEFDSKLASPYYFWQNDVVYVIICSIPLL